MSLESTASEGRLRFLCEERGDSGSGVRRSIDENETCHEAPECAPEPDTDNFRHHQFIRISSVLELEVTLHGYRTIFRFERESLTCALQRLVAGVSNEC